MKASPAKKASPVKKASPARKPSPAKKASPARVEETSVLKKRSHKSASRSVTKSASITPQKPQKKVKAGILFPQLKNLLAPAPTPPVQSSNKKPVSPVQLAKDVKKNVNEGELRTRLNAFKKTMGSNSSGDVKKNAEVLGEVVKGFSSSYGVDISDVMTMLAKEKNGINLDDMRHRLGNM